MTDNPTLPERLHGVAEFYRSSINMGDMVADVHSAKGHFVLTPDDLDGAADELERLRAALERIAEGEYDYGSHIAERAIGREVCP